MTFKFEVGDIVEILNFSPYYGLTLLVSSVNEGGYFLIPICEIPEKLKNTGFKLGVVEPCPVGWVEYNMQKVS